MCFDIGSQHLRCWGQNTSRIQNKEIYATLCLQALELIHFFITLYLQAVNFFILNYNIFLYNIVFAGRKFLYPELIINIITPHCVFRPIITNKEAIAVNQQWSGDSGRLLAQSSALVTLPNCGAGTPCKVPQWMVWCKALPPLPSNAQGNHSTAQSSRAAVFLLNNDHAPGNVSTSLLSVLGLGPCGSEGCSVRDVWNKSNLPVTHGDGLVSAVLVSRVVVDHSPN